jgi:hypothetical protein
MAAVAAHPSLGVKAHESIRVARHQHSVDHDQRDAARDGERPDAQRPDYIVRVRTDLCGVRRRAMMRAK